MHVLQVMSSSLYHVLPLHSGVPSKEQRLVFDAVPKGHRKIVLATNVRDTPLMLYVIAVIDHYE
jgi:HrpA-like RNA helicase